MKKLIVSTLSIGMICLSTLVGACNTPLNNNTKLMNTTDSTKGFAVVELFTSEGCSSCPPADELLAELEKQSNGLPVYLLAYHVDYWDHQGWKDSFSQHIFSTRQQEYAAWMGLSSVYTPQMVINGNTEFVGSDAGKAASVINKALTSSTNVSLSLQAKTNTQKVDVTWQLSAPQKNTRLLLAFVQKNAQSNVRAGENAGRKLSHVQIVKELTTVDPKNSTNVSLELPAGFNEQNWELIGLLQKNNNGNIVAATKVNIQK